LSAAVLDTVAPMHPARRSSESSLGVHCREPEALLGPKVTVLTCGSSVVGDGALKVERSVHTSVLLRRSDEAAVALAGAHDEHE